MISDMNTAITKLTTRETHNDHPGSIPNNKSRTNRSNDMSNDDPSNRPNKDPSNRHGNVPSYRRDDNPNYSILIAGGHDGQTCTKSSEMFSFASNTWTTLGEMREGRLAPSVFVYQNNVIVAGGFNGETSTDKLEGIRFTLNVNLAVVWQSHVLWKYLNVVENRLTKVNKGYDVIQNAFPRSKNDHSF